MIKKLIYLIYSIFCSLYVKLICILAFIFLSSCSNQNAISQQYIMNAFEEKPPVPLLVYTTTSQANDDIVALNNALAKASQTCNMLKMRAEIMSTEYNRIGYTNRQQNLINQANNKLGTNYSATSNEDYIALLRFKCIPYEQPQLITEANRAVGKQF